MPRSKDEILESFLLINRYFGSQENSAFNPEFEASQKVISIIRNGNLSRKNLEEIVQIFNDVTAGKYINGAHWYDFELRILSLIYKCGFEGIHEGNKIRIK